MIECWVLMLLFVLNCKLLLLVLIHTVINLNHLTCRIEHLHSDVLNAVPHTVFEFIRPALALFTTPNVEFNILFPNFHTEFRHDDHKFEWTRKQLKDW
jgi:hypothetical protein